MKPPRAEVCQRVPARLGEAPCWHPGRGSLWWLDIAGQQFFEWRLAGVTVRRRPLPQLPGAAVVTSDGRFLVALRDGLYLLAPDDDALVPYATAAQHDPKDFRFNDGKVDPQGRLWVGTLALDGRAGQSKLFRVTRDRQVQTMLDGVTISNGLAWTPDGRTLYYVDSPTRRVQAFDFDGEKGTLLRGRTAIVLEDGDGWPDGCCMDAEGCLWLAHWGAGKVTRWDPAAGRRLLTVTLPVTNVTSCAFGGTKLDRLFVTTASPDEGAKPEPEAGFLFEIVPGTAGLAVPPFLL